MSFLELRNVKKRFGGLRAVDGVSFTLEKGGVLGLVGPNGSGKTTLLNLITGLLPVTAGNISFEGANITSQPAHKIASIGIARTFQLVRIMENMSVRENVAVASMHGANYFSPSEAMSAAETVLLRVDLSTLADRPASTLTYIDQKRLELARALAISPKLLLLDEWLAGLNPTELRSGVALIQRLSDEGITIIMIEHVMEAIHELCHRVIVMNSGSVLADESPRAALSDPAVLRAYLGDDEGEMADA
tara:strand:- start:7426 stop:8166 length:741 start_codon:yes stop_codon:yes gene_type:complete